MAGTVIVLAFGATLLLYSNAVRLPLFFDDMIHLRWLDWHSLSATWTTGEGLGYYRPLTMSFWKIGFSLLGYHDPVLYHLLNLVLHALNATLVGFVAWRAFIGRGRVAYTLLATALFSSFPFSYQAVPSSSSLSKPLIAFLTLSSVLFYWEARRHDSRWRFALSLLLGMSAPFAYESGVMVPVAILAVEVLGHYRNEFRRWSWLPTTHAILIWGIALPIVVLMEPETGASVSFSSLTSLWQNGVYFVEGLLFPISLVGTPLQQATGIDQYVLLSAIDLVGLAALFGFYWWARQIHLFLYALSWFVVGIAPLWLMLDFAYVITSPRLLYLGAVGSAVMWAGIPVLLWSRLPARRWPKALAAVGATVMLAFSINYVRDKMELASTMSDPLWQAAHAAEAQGPSSRLLYINVPAWIAPKQPTYRIGTEGLTFIPEYVRVQDFVYVNTGVEPEIRAYMFDAVKEDWPAYIGYAGTALDRDRLAHEVRQADAVYRTVYSSSGLHFVEAGSVDPGQPTTPSHRDRARFGDEIALIEYETAPWTEGVVLHLWWLCKGPVQGNVTVFTHATDSTGQLVAQADGDPVLGLFSPGTCETGDLVHDVRYIALPEDLRGMEPSIGVGWYNRATGERLPAVAGDGQRAADDMIRLVP
jgi:hypothetical protein